MFGLIPSCFCLQLILKFISQIWSKLSLIPFYRPNGHSTVSLKHFQLAGLMISYRQEVQEKTIVKLTTGSKCYALTLWLRFRPLHKSREKSCLTSSYCYLLLIIFRLVLYKCLVETKPWESSINVSITSIYPALPYYSLMLAEKSQSESVF